MSKEFSEFTSSRDFDDTAMDDQNYDLSQLYLVSESQLREQEKIYIQVENQFNEVIEYAKQYQRFIDFHDVNIKTNYLDPKTVAQIEFFREIITTHKDQEKDIEQLDIQSSIKIFRINAQEMIQEIKQSPLRCLKDIKKFLPDLSYEKVCTLCAELQAMEKLLERKPKNVDEYCEIMKYLRETAEYIDEVAEKYQSIGELHIIM